MRAIGRQGAAVLGALAVTVVAAVVIVTLGRNPPPAYPRRVDETAFGTVAFLRKECLFVVPARGGDPRRLRCLDNAASDPAALRWRDDERLVVRVYGTLAQDVVVDPATGRELDRQPVPEPEPKRQTDPARRSDSTLAYAGARGALYVRPPNGTARRVLAASGPRDYTYEAVSWSPDGRFLLVADSERRLLVVAVEGDPRPRLLVEDAQAAAAWGRWAR